jgi:Na+/H+-translocating membrane pyrophosphatase
MGADLFGSFAESTSATLVVCASINDFYNNRSALYFPVFVSAFGIIVCLITSLYAT